MSYLQRYSLTLRRRSWSFGHSDRSTSHGIPNDCAFRAPKMMTLALTTDDRLSTVVKKNPSVKSAGLRFSSMLLHIPAKTDRAF